MRLCRVWDQNEVKIAQIVHAPLLCMIKDIITHNLALKMQPNAHTKGETFLEITLPFTRSW
ncbi:hypothetical protein ALQ64_200017 [Pseudomonas cannabina]|uniref:Uncharacterized protein n=1 Tax=Pseudomonas cannabina TaxID=86840 RepID=A0A0P9LTG3_PSECA|nr:hypothetical protein ALO81_200005 [Pseudomonas cannabina]RMN38291.1 hypothetical protein ALQ64_200017 [Pseudomonas cannabina]